MFLNFLQDPTLTLIIKFTEKAQQYVNKTSNIMLQMLSILIRHFKGGMHNRESLMSLGSRKLVVQSV